MPVLQFRFPGNILYICLCGMPAFHRAVYVCFVFSWPVQVNQGEESLNFLHESARALYSALLFIRMCRGGILAATSADSFMQCFMCIENAQEMIAPSIPIISAPYWAQETRMLEIHNFKPFYAWILSRSKNFHRRINHSLLFNRNFLQILNSCLKAKATSITPNATD